MTFSKTVSMWLERSVAAKRSNDVPELPLHICSDVGVARTENQDRAAVLWKGAGDGGSFLAAVVSDGMGGMKDGGRCASIAVTSFLYYLVHNSNVELGERVGQAIEYSNAEVSGIYSGRGGATLSALVLANGAVTLANVGDSRIYSFEYGGQVKRRTVDDSLAEMVGGSGRELIQFIGMGEGIKVSTSTLDESFECFALTTDGIHGMEEQTLFDVIKHAKSCGQAAERLVALARWCGGYDNSTCIVLDVAKSISELSGGMHGEDGMVRIWDPSGEICLEADEEPELPRVSVSEAVTNSDAEITPMKKPSEPKTRERSRPKSKAKKKEGKASKNGAREEVQLSIEIGTQTDLGGSGGGDDRK